MALDEKLVAALQSGAIKLIRADYLRGLEPGVRILRRQDLEALEREKGLRIFLSPKEAVDALLANGRLIGALTYGWTAPGDPDVSGAYLAAVGRFLRSAAGAHIEAVFWECARTVPQRTCALRLRRVTQTD